MKSAAELGVGYPIKFLQEHSPRELAELSQSDVTKDPKQGLQFAAAAYDASLTPAVYESDYTLPGIASRQAGFRAEQAGYSTAEVNAWFQLSKQFLGGRDQLSLRELSATYLLEGRVTALRRLRSDTELRYRVLTVAEYNFRLAENILSSQHKRFRAWDPYATMLNRHWATYEAISHWGDSKSAAKIAVNGVYRALRASRVEADNPSEVTAFSKRARFVGKQTLGNAVAMGLAVTKPLEKRPKIQEIRRKVALKLLG